MLTCHCLESDVGHDYRSCESLKARTGEGFALSFSGCDLLLDLSCFPWMHWTEVVTWPAYSILANLSTVFAGQAKIQMLTCFVFLIHVLPFVQGEVKSSINGILAKKTGDSACSLLSASRLFVTCLLG